MFTRAILASSLMMIFFYFLFYDHHNNIGYEIDKFFFEFYVFFFSRIMVSKIHDGFRWFQKLRLCYSCVFGLSQHKSFFFHKNNIPNFHHKNVVYGVSPTKSALVCVFVKCFYRIRVVLLFFCILYKFCEISLVVRM